jgi:hypothetical protein
MLGAKQSPQLPLPPPPIGFDESFLSEEIRGWFPLGFHRRRSPPTRCLVGPSPGACWATTGACDVCVHAGDAMLLVCRGEDYPGQPLAGRVGTALPCRPDEHLGDGERVLLLSTLLIPLQSWSLAIWSRPVSQAHRLCSVMLLLMQTCHVEFS